MKVTFFKNLFSKNEPHHAHVMTALERIKSGQSQTTIEEVRSGNKEAKKKLPVVCFSGEFTDRTDEGLFEHSGLIVLDFDHVDVDKSKNVLATDSYVYSCWISPSGDGLKALVRITNPERHRDHFRALKTYFYKQYDLEVDESGINESRACFESYDPEIVINEDSQKFGAFSTEKSESQVAVQKNVYTDYIKLNLAARMIRMAEDGDKHKTLLRASILCGGYIAAGRMEEDEVVRVLLREISKRDIDSESTAINTIRDGIEEGKKMPIKDLIHNERSAEREMRINDGDMSFISSDDTDFRMIDDFANGKIELGLTTGNDEFDNFFRYKREFVIINGHSNVGKTTMALYMIVNSSVRHGWKWLIYSSENTTWSVKMTLMEFALNMRISDMDYNQRKAAFKWVNDHYVLINNSDVYSYSDIVLFMEKTMRMQDIDAVFIDPYNSLKIDMKSNSIGVHDYHYEAASEFLTFTKSKNIALWLNTHAVTEAQRRKGDDGLPVAPYAEDTEGGGKFVNRADCFMTFHRKIQAPDPHIKKTTEIHVRKVRETKTGGMPTPIDEPFLMSINPSMTAFRSVSTLKSLFDSIGNTFEQYKTFH